MRPANHSSQTLFPPIRGGSVPGIDAHDAAVRGHLDAVDVEPERRPVVGGRQVGPRVERKPAEPRGPASVAADEHVAASAGSLVPA